MISTTALDYAALTVAGTDIHSLAGPEQFRHYLDSVPDVYPLFRLVPLGAVIAAAGLGARAIRRRRVRKSPDVVLIAWLIVPVLAFTWEWTEVAPHYMIPLMPAAYLLCGVGIQEIGHRLTQINADFKKRFMAGRAILAGIGLFVVVIAGLQIYLLARLLDFLDTHATPGGFGTPLHYLMDARAAVLDQNPERRDRDQRGRTRAV